MINSLNSYSPNFNGAYQIKYAKLSAQNKSNVNGFIKYCQNNGYIKENETIKNNPKSIILFIKESIDKKAEEFFSENFIGFKKINK